LLAREGSVSNNGSVIFRTPLLVPSFSSKGFPDMKGIISMMTEFITEAVLVSAYDIHYKLLSAKRLTFPSVIFLDSGGYEARVEHDLSETYGKDYKPKKWRLRDYRAVLANWRSSVPTVIVSYDSPRRHSSLERQVVGALKLKREFPAFLHEFLIKPEHKKELIEPSKIEIIADSLREFSLIGLTEHELDHRMIGRMEKLARIRVMLDAKGIKIPIHVFGSLDSFSTVLYFLSGAEVFDGLTWLRFGFHDGCTMYRQNYGAIRGENGILKNVEELSHSMWKDNYYYLESLRDQMCNYARTQRFDSFEHISAPVEKAVRQLQSRVSG
jgi:hypothetical protein